MGKGGRNLDVESQSSAKLFTLLIKTYFSSLLSIDLLIKGDVNVYVFTRSDINILLINPGGWKVRYID